jgi:hypothetical protein
VTFSVSRVFVLVSYDYLPLDEMVVPVVPDERVEEEGINMTSTADEDERAEEETNTTAAVEAEERVEERAEERAEERVERTEERKTPPPTALILEDFGDSYAYDAGFVGSSSSRYMRRLSPLPALLLCVMSLVVFGVLYVFLF